MATNGITLYRGITPGTFRMDVHGGYGETWTREFDWLNGTPALHKVMYWKPFYYPRQNSLF
jgi:hypothetical protein